MQCQRCGYTLLNIAGGRCPECGEAYDLRDYRFEPQTVAFACPHCEHLHSGQGEFHQPGGDETPVCRACGEVMELSAIRVVPLVSHVHAQPVRQTPWDRSRQLGFLRAWWETCRQSMMQPSILAASIGSSSRTFAALCFVLTGCLFAMAIWGLLALGIAGILFILTHFIAEQTANDRLVAAMYLTLKIGLVLAASPLPLLIHMWLIIPAAHLLLMITGPLRGGLGRTTTAIAYGHGPIILAVLPLAGPVLAYLWILAATIPMLSAVQGVSPARAALAALTLPTFLILAAIAIAALRIVPML